MPLLREWLCLSSTDIICWIYCHCRSAFGLAELRSREVARNQRIRYDIILRSRADEDDFYISQDMILKSYVLSLTCPSSHFDLLQSHQKHCIKSNQSIHQSCRPLQTRPIPANISPLSSRRRALPLKSSTGGPLPQVPTSSSSK